MTYTTEYLQDQLNACYAIRNGYGWLRYSKGTQDACMEAIQRLEKQINERKATL